MAQKCRNDMALYLLLATCITVVVEGQMNHGCNKLSLLPSNFTERFMSFHGEACYETGWECILSSLHLRFYNSSATHKNAKLLSGRLEKNSPGLKVEGNPQMDLRSQVLYFSIKQKSKEC